MTRDLTKKVTNLASELKLKIVTAESCTAGRVASQLTRRKGSSKIFSGGIIVYDNDAKVNLLDVSKRVLDNEGPYNGRVVAQMTRGLLTKFPDAHVAVATSGMSPTFKEQEVEEKGRPGMLYVGLQVRGWGGYSEEVDLTEYSDREEWLEAATQETLYHLNEFLIDIRKRSLKEGKHES